MHLPTATLRATGSMTIAIPVVEDFVRTLSDDELRLWMDPQIKFGAKPFWPGQLRFLTQAECLLVLDTLNRVPSHERLCPAGMIRPDEVVIGSVMAHAKNAETLQAGADTIYFKSIVQWLEKNGHSDRTKHIRQLRNNSQLDGTSYDVGIMPAYELRFGTPLFH